MAASFTRKRKFEFIADGENRVRKAFPEDSERSKRKRRKILVNMDDPGDFCIPPRQEVISYTILFKTPQRQDHESIDQLRCLLKQTDEELAACRNRLVCAEKRIKLQEAQNKDLRSRIQRAEEEAELESQLSDCAVADTVGASSCLLCLEKVCKWKSLTVVQPCWHVICGTCSKEHGYQLKHCPLCKTAIKQFRSLYL